MNHPSSPALSETEKILQKLVSFPVLGGESNLSIITWIKEFIETQGVETYWVANETGDKAGLHCRIGPEAEGGIILSGHTDVVPVEGQDWNTSPFMMTDGGDGNWYGRGTCDMKGFLACCLSSLARMKAVPLVKPIYLAFSYDEEIGCLGAPALIRHISQTYKVPPRFAIIGEPTGMKPVIGQKGICVLETIVNGSAGHSSRIRQEVSAVHEAARLVVLLEEKMNRFIEAGRLDLRFDPPHSSIHVGQLTGGIAPNVIADKAVFHWDIRVIPGDRVEDILEDFSGNCRKREEELRKIFPEFKIETIIHHPPVPPLDTSAQSDVLRLVQSLTGEREWETVAYAAEAGQFAEGGFESIICGPGSIAQAHRANEYISKDQLRKGEEMIRNLIEFCCQG